MEFILVHIKIKLIPDNNFIWIELNGEKSYLGKIEPESAKEILSNNFKLVYNNYKKCVPSFFHLKDFENNLAEVSVKIMLRYFRMHLDWKNHNPHFQNQDLNFNTKDFDHPYTRDDLIAFFKRIYPFCYLEICACILNKTSNEIEKYIKDRDSFYEFFK